jgi:hypothetical protein
VGFLSFTWCSAVYFEMEEYESAKKAFAHGMKLRQEQESKRDTAPYARFIRKCNAEIAGASSFFFFLSTHLMFCML